MSEQHSECFASTRTLIRSCSLGSLKSRYLPDILLILAEMRYPHQGFPLRAQTRTSRVFEFFSLQFSLWLRRGLPFTLSPTPCRKSISPFSEIKVESIHRQLCLKLSLCVIMEMRNDENVLSISKGSSSASSFNGSYDARDRRFVSRRQS